MVFIYSIAIAVVVLQLAFVFQVWRNCKYVLSKSQKQRKVYRPKVALVIPCKGIDTEFEKNITSFYHQDYDDYELIFVTESDDDLACKKLEQIKNDLADKSKAFSVRLLVAGVTKTGSQKIHNMLCGYHDISDGVEILAFADSDAHIKPNWIEHIVYPLRKSKAGLASGYRWFVPIENNLATLALSAINGKIAQNLGATPFNQAWGGSMAVTVETFENLGVEDVWKKAISDDLSLSRLVKKAHRMVVFVPACFVASYEKTTWGELFEFARRQFLITRVTLFGTWLFGLISGMYAVFGFWGLAIIACVVGLAGIGNWMLLAVCAGLFLACQEVRAVIRQRMIFKLLPDDARKMTAAKWADIIGNPVWSLLMLVFILTSAVGRTIKWRGVKYKLLSATDVVKG